MYYQKAKIQNPIDKYGFHEFTNYPCRKDWHHCLIKENRYIYLKGKHNGTVNKMYKQKTNRRFRKNNEVSEYNWYKKIFDLQWNLF